jgi:nitroimidazol reductase NimA-like FMN-containing flavoprotein (pyridoxamine 5'-phosphate oxidase superfamily)
LQTIGKKAGALSGTAWDFRPCPVQVGRRTLTDMWQNERALVVLSQRECLALLRSEQVGRVVFTEKALPAVIPVTYAVLDDAIVLATRAGSRLARSARGGVLAFEADRLDPVTRTGWSVVVTGMAEYVSDPAEVARIRTVLDPWAPGGHNLVLRLPLTVVTGRRVETDGLPGSSPAGVLIG